MSIFAKWFFSIVAVKVPFFSSIVIDLTKKSISGALKSFSVFLMFGVLLVPVLSTITFLNLFLYFFNNSNFINSLVSNKSETDDTKW